MDKPAKPRTTKPYIRANSRWMRKGSLSVPAVFGHCACSRSADDVAVLFGRPSAPGRPLGIKLVRLGAAVSTRCCHANEQRIPASQQRVVTVP